MPTGMMGLPDRSSKLRQHCNAVLSRPIVLALTATVLLTCAACTDSPGRVSHPSRRHTLSLEQLSEFEAEKREWIRQTDPGALFVLDDARAEEADIESIPETAATVIPTDVETGVDASSGNDTELDVVSTNKPDLPLTEQPIVSSGSFELAAVRALNFSAGYSASPGTVLAFAINGSPLPTGTKGPNASLPQPIAFLPATASFVGAGGHSGAVTADGQLWTWGRNDSAGGGLHGSQAIPNAGQLGNPRWPEQASASQVQADMKFTAFDSGRYHSAAIDSDGNLYTWGLNDFGQLGRDGKNREGSACSDGFECRDPDIVKIEVPGEKFVAVAAGRYHTLGVTASGAVYTCGLNYGGNYEVLTHALEELKAPNQSTLKRLTRVTGFPDDAYIVAVSAGYQLWVALSDDGRVFVSDTGFDGYAGTLESSILHGGWSTINQGGYLGRTDIPSEISSLVPWVIQGLNATCIAAGRVQAAAVGVDGNVYSWGSGMLGRSLPRGGSPATAGIVAGIGTPEAPESVVKVCLAEYSAFAVTASGKVYMWGSGQNLGTMATSAMLLSSWPAEHSATALACGYQHVLVTASPSLAADPAVQVKEDVEVTETDEFWHGAIQAPFEKCPSGLPHPAWITSCDNIPENIPALDLAFFGQYVTPSLEKIKAAAPDVFDDIQLPFIDNVRNPCYVNAAGIIRCLPYASIIGVSKAGTTDLYRKLMLVKPFMESKNKGPHFWDENHPWSFHTGMYQPLADLVRDHTNETVSQLHLDASSNSFSVSGVQIRLQKNPEVLLPEVMRAVQQHMKVVVIMREPIARFYSAFWYYGCRYNVYRRHGMTPDGFHSLAEECVARMDDCAATAKSVRQCARENFDTSQQLVKGMYASSVPDWLDVYPREQVLWIRAEDYYADERKYIQYIIHWLDLDEPSEEQWTRITAREANRGHGPPSDVEGCDHESRPEMLEKTRLLLQKVYTPWNKMLGAQLGSHLTWEY